MLSLWNNINMYIWQILHQCLSFIKFISVLILQALKLNSVIFVHSNVYVLHVESLCCIIVVFCVVQCDWCLSDISMARHWQVPWQIHSKRVENPGVSLVSFLLLLLRQSWLSGWDSVKVSSRTLGASHPGDQIHCTVTWMSVIKGELNVNTKW